MNTQINNLEAVTSNTNFVKGAKLKEIGNFKVQLSGAEKRTFEVTLNIAKNVHFACEYFKGEECKKILKDANCELNMKQFGKEVFQYESSFFMELKKVGSLSTEIIEEFKSLCSASNSNLSIRELLKFSKGTEGSEGEGEGEVKVKSEGFKVTICKDGKIVVKGIESVTKEQFTNLIAELKKLENSAK